MCNYHISSAKKRKGSLTGMTGMTSCMTGIKGMTSGLTRGIGVFPNITEIQQIQGI